LLTFKYKEFRKYWYPILLCMKNTAHFKEKNVCM
jgi:hypothetical protein